MSLNMDNLDADELMHLAMQASQNGKPEQSITFLKQAITLEPKNEKLLYLLAAEHAQIGLYDRAKEEMAAALELNPNFSAIRFQLGLLHLTSGDAVNALAVLGPLKDNPETDCFFHFAHGLEYLIADQFPACKVSLEKGISLNQSNAALNADMQKIISAVNDKLNESGAEKPTGVIEPIKATGDDAWRSAYQADAE